MIKLTDDTRRYIQATWGFNGSADCDEIVMLWNAGYYSEATWCLMDAGAFCFDEDCTPKEVAKEVKQVFKTLSRHDVNTAIEACLNTDYTIFVCKSCEHPHYINSLYQDERETWPCDSCNERGLK